MEFIGRLSHELSMFFKKKIYIYIYIYIYTDNDNDNIEVTITLETVAYPGNHFFPYMLIGNII